MHAEGLSVDLNRLVQLILTLLVAGLAFLYLVRNAASRYFDAHAAFASPPAMPSADSCIVCASPAPKKCSRCKAVRYW